MGNREDSELASLEDKQPPILFLPAGKKILSQMRFWINIKLCVWLYNPLLKDIAQPGLNRLSHLKKKKGYLRILSVLCCGSSSHRP